jgi:hypothetical protein
VRTTLESTLARWIARPIFGQGIVGVTDLVQGSADGRGPRGWRTLVAFVGARLGEPINWVPRLIVQGADVP